MIRRLVIAVALLAQIGATNGLADDALPIAINGKISDVAVKIPVTEDLFLVIETSDGRRVPLQFFDKTAQLNAADTAKELASGGELRIASFSYNFGGDAHCTGPSRLADLCEQARRGPEGAYISQVVIGEARSERSFAEAYPAQAEAAREKGGAYISGDDAFFFVDIGTVEFFFECRLLLDRFQAAVCSSAYYPQNNFSVLFRARVPIGALSPEILSVLALSVQDLVEDFMLGGESL